MIEFNEFPKIARFNRDVIVTEKIDGTNAQVFIDDDGNLFAGSRNRWLTVDKDNFGFARWVEDNREELLKLGPGRHFGEWWGNGIQRGYGLKAKRFSLFNTSRWTNETCPACCHVVPILFTGLMEELNTKAILDTLEETGSMASPGFMSPEGIVIFHVAGNVMFKRTIKNDEKHKGEL